MIRSLKVLSLLLSYPSTDIIAAASGFADIIDAEEVIPAAQRKALKRLFSELANDDIYDSQERYVLLFDRSRTLSLNLFEHVHGESRDRGQAMVDLKELYGNHGLELDATELPDHLPLFLEFLSTLPFGQTQEMLADVVHITSALKERLRKRKSSYAAVFWSLEGLTNAQPDKAVLEAMLAEPDVDPDDFEAMDKLWEEEQVTFGPGPNAAAACGPDRLAAQMRAGMRPAPEPGSNAPIPGSN
jgi:nitrate reductase delta subunit